MAEFGVGNDVMETRWRWPARRVRIDIFKQVLQDEEDIAS
jgi:hypothetical protein